MNTTAGGSNSSNSTQNESGNNGVAAKLTVGSNTASPRKRASILNAGNEITSTQMTSFGIHESDDSSNSQFEE